MASWDCVGFGPKENATRVIIVTSNMSGKQDQELLHRRDLGAAHKVKARRKKKEKSEAK